MKNILYKQRPFIKRAYLFPIYILPILIGLTKSYQIVPLFTILFSILLFLLTCWSDKFEILFTMYLSDKPSHIFFNNTLCKITNSTFTKNRSKYLIKDKKIVRLVPDTKKEFNFFKSGKEYIDKDLIEHYPLNFFRIEPPTFIQQFGKHATTPFFVFQIFCGILWCLDEYVYQALFTIFMLIAVEAGLVLQRIISMKQFRTMNHQIIQVELINDPIIDSSKKDIYKGDKINYDSHTKKEKISIIDSSKKEKVSIIDSSKKEKVSIIDSSKKEKVSIIDSIKILPGNVIRIRECIRVPCDLLLLKGSCAVNEAILTGESIPLTKEDISEVEGSRIFDFEKDKKHVLFAGTDIIKIEKSTNRDSEFIECFVLKTGFDTVQGELIKKMMCGEEVSVNDKEAFGFIGILLFFAVISSCYTLREGLKMGKPGYKIFLECILIITNVVPTELPLELSMAVNSCVASLRMLGIFCLEPFRIPYAGKVNVCCFDKTGTLTETSLDVEDIKYTVNDTIDVLRTCHTLISLNNKITGDPLETSVYEYLNKIALKSNNINIQGDIKMDNTDFIKSVNSTLDKKYIIKKRYLFSSELKRMTVVYESNKQVYVSMKGAPEVIKEYLVSVPPLYNKYEEYAKDGFRVIALASKPFKKRNQYIRSEVEENMNFAGFILFDCKIKEYARETIKDLKESGHKVIMITGDNLLTAVSVAKKLGILDSINKDTKKYGVEGSNIDNILYSDEFESFTVFARADPNHKEKIIERYNRMGYYTLMCGDGTNDVGALKSAHVGVALVESSVQVKQKVVIKEATTPQQVLLNKLAEEMNDQVPVKMGDASVAAPFTAKTKSLECILNIIRQGRSALVTTIQMYKILALNSLVNAFSLSVLDCMGIRYGEYQLVASGLLIAFAFTFLTKNTPLKKISKERPLTTIFNKYMMSSIVLQVIIHISSYFIVLDKLKSVETVVYDEKFKPSMTNTALFLLSTAQQISTFLVNYIGRPFRESLVENRKLLGCLILLLGFIFYILFDMNEDFSRVMEVISLNDLRYFMGCVILGDIFLCFVVERICFKYFMFDQ
jgi:manganese-transporting P-type ATPase